MPENHSREGKPVERVEITDEPHERYWDHDPWTGEKLSHGRPILETVPGGAIVRKEITYYDVKCPDCEVTSVYNSDSEPICPDCGMICSDGSSILQEQIVRDAKAAGRIDGNNGQSP